MTNTNSRQTILSDIAAYVELTNRPHIVALTPAERIIAARKAWFKADMRHCAAFLSAARNAAEMTAACIERAQIADSLNLLQRHEEFEAAYFEQLQAAADLQTESSAPRHLPAVNSPAEKPIDHAEGYDRNRARRACFAAIADAKLPKDTAMMRAAYSDHFNEFAGSTTSNWTAARWTKLANAVRGETWKNAGGRWLKVARYNGVVMKVAA